MGILTTNGHEWGRDAGMGGIGGEGFAQRTQRTQRLGRGIAEMFLCLMGIDHEWARIDTNGEGRGNGRG